MFQKPLKHFLTGIRLLKADRKTSQARSVRRDPELNDRRFRPCERLRLRADFSRVFAEKRSAGDELLIVYVSANHLAWSRLGLSVGKRVGRAVQRNRVRRRLREAFRLNKSKLPQGYDIVCVAKPALADWQGDPGSRLHKLTLTALRRPARNKARSDRDEAR